MISEKQETRMHSHTCSVPVPWQSNAIYAVQSVEEKDWADSLYNGFIESPAALSVCVCVAKRGAQRTR